MAAKNAKSKLKQSSKLSKKGALLIVAAVALIGAAVVYTSHASSCVYGTFRVGSSGQCVKNIQGMVGTQIAHSDTSKYLAVDGKYGSKTRDYVKLFQASRGVSPADGVVGPKTWQVLCNLGFGGGDGTSTAGFPQWVKVFKVYATNAGCK